MCKREKLVTWPPPPSPTRRSLQTFSSSPPSMNKKNSRSKALDIIEMWWKHATTYFLSQWYWFPCVGKTKNSCVPKLFLKFFWREVEIYPKGCVNTLSIFQNAKRIHSKTDWTKNDPVAQPAHWCRVTFRALKMNNVKYVHSENESKVRCFDFSQNDFVCLCWRGSFSVLTIKPMWTFITIHHWILTNGHDINSFVEIVGEVCRFLYKSCCRAYK